MKWQSADSILDITVDRDRGILYTLSEYGTITVYDLGEARDGMRRVCALTLKQMVDSMREAFKKEGKYEGKRVFFSCSLIHPQNEVSFKFLIISCLGLSYSIQDFP